MRTRESMKNSDLKELEQELMIAYKYGLSKDEIQKLKTLIEIEKAKAPEKKSLLERLKR
jgi:predicted transcriptional regulator